MKQLDWRVAFHVTAREVSDAITGGGRMSSHFELAAPGIRFGGLPRPHPCPPERHWIVLYGKFTLEQAATARYGLDPLEVTPSGNGGPAGLAERANVFIQIWPTTPGTCEAELRIAPPDLLPHSQDSYVDGLPLPTGRLARLLAAFMEALSYWPDRGGPQPWFLGRPDLVVQWPLGARVLAPASPPANGRAIPAPARAWHRGGRPRFPEDAWAFDQVESMCRPVCDVYLEWRELLSPERLEALTQPYHAFTQMIYRKRQEARSQG